MSKERLKHFYDKIINMRLPIERDFTEKDFNSFIAVGFLPGADIYKLIGRIVQVREEWGCFGSNQIFMRCCNGELQCHENQWFYKIPEVIVPELQNIFRDVELDKKNITYSLNGKFKRKGFNIKSKIKPGNTTPMREVRKEIINILTQTPK